MRIEPLTCAIGAELIGVNLAQAAHDDELFGRIKTALLQYKVLFLRDQNISRADHVAFADRFGKLEDSSGRRQSSGLSGPRANLQNARRRVRSLRECVAHRRDVARGATDGLCSALRRVSADRRRHDVGEHGAGVREPADEIKARIADLRARHSIEASFGAAMPKEKRLALKARFPDAEHPVVRTHPETGEKVLFVNAFTTHFTNYHTPANVRYGQDANPGRRRSAALSDQPGLHSRVPGALALAAEQRRDLGQPQHAALRGHGLPALPSQDGTRRNRGRRTFLKSHPQARGPAL